MRIECKNCGSSGHPTYACTRPAKISGAVSNAAKSPLPRKQVVGAGAQSTAARKDVQRDLAPRGARDNLTAKVGGNLQGRHLPREDHKPQAGTQAPPVDTTLRPGRPRTGFDKAAYNREYMRNKRARVKSSKQALNTRVGA
jgi:hypothetical protein